jgi:cytochrome c-type biogenesis protein CcmE
MRSRARFAIAITLAVALGGWLIWASLGGSLEEYTSPGSIAAGTSGDGTYRLNGKVAAGTPANAAAQAQSEGGLRFTIVDKDDPSKQVPVVYRGSVPDTFAVGREVVVTGHVRNGVFEANNNSLIALCPSKFSEQAPSQSASAD